MSLVLEVKNEKQVLPAERLKLLLSTHGAYFGFTAYHPDEGFNPCRMSDVKDIDKETWDATLEKYKDQNMVMCFSDASLEDDAQQPIVLFGNDDDAIVVAYITQHTPNDAMKDIIEANLSELWEIAGEDLSKFMELVQRPRQSSRLTVALGKGALILHTKTGELLTLHDSPTCHVYPHGFTSNHLGWGLPKVAEPTPEPKKVLALGGKPLSVKPVTAAQIVAPTVRENLKSSVSPEAVEVAQAEEIWAKPPAKILSNDERALKQWYKRYPKGTCPTNYKERPAVIVRVFLPDQMDRATKPAPIANVTPVSVVPVKSSVEHPAKYIILGTVGTKTLEDWNKGVDPAKIIPNPLTLIEREGKLPTITNQCSTVTTERLCSVPLVDMAKLPTSIILAAFSQIRLDYARAKIEFDKQKELLEAHRLANPTRKVAM